jgi:hypothetical protein
MKNMKALLFTVFPALNNMIGLILVFLAKSKLLINLPFVFSLKNNNSVAFNFKHINILE